MDLSETGDRVNEIIVEQRLLAEELARMRRRQAEIGARLAMLNRVMVSIRVKLEKRP